MYSEEEVVMGGRGWCYVGPLLIRRLVQHHPVSVLAGGYLGVDIVLTVAVALAYCSCVPVHQLQRILDARKREVDDWLSRSMDMATIG